MNNELFSFGSAREINAKDTIKTTDRNFLTFAMDNDNSSIDSNSASRIVYLGVSMREPNAYEKLDRISDDSSLKIWSKVLLRLKVCISEISQRIISSPVFESFIIFVIILNIVCLALENPNGERNSTLVLLDEIFLMVYTFEASLKIAGMGIKQYFKDFWNILDFTIVSTGWILFLYEEGVNLSALRTFRVLRPLRSISSIKGLRALITALGNSSKPLFFSLSMLFSLILLFAIAGVHLWVGSFKYKCLRIADGIENQMICGNFECPSGYECANTLDNPNLGITNFDNLFFAFLTVFQCVTLEEWSEIMEFTQRTSGYGGVLYFFCLVFTCAFIMVDFILAVIKYHFTNAMDIERKEGLSRHKSELAQYEQELESRCAVLKPTIIDQTIDEIDSMSPLRRGSAIRTIPMSIQRSFATKYNTQDRDQNCIFVIECGELVSDSKTDVLPCDRVIKEKKHFAYRIPEPDFLQINWEEFSRLALRMPKDQAFFKVLSSAFYTVIDYGDPGEWSGIDVDPQSSMEIDEFSTMKFVLWSRSLRGLFEQLKFLTGIIVEHRAFNYMMILFVFLNTIVLSLDHYKINSDLETVLIILNNIFSMIFAIEMVLKMIGLGLKAYFSEAMNYLDSVVVCLSIIEIALLSDTTSITALRTFRVFRVFRVLKVARLFRYINLLSMILNVVVKSIYSFIYLAILLLLLVTIFSLLGMQIFGGQLSDDRVHFDTFNSAFITVFMVLSLENWPSILYDAMNSEMGKLSCIYFISWILIGNFVILNLFLAILLDSFDTDDEEARLLEEVENEVDNSNNNRRRRSSIFRENIEIKIQESIKQLELQHKGDIDYKKLNTSKLFNQPIFLKIKVSRSCFLFSDNNKIREICNDIADSYIFEVVIFVLICMSSLKLAWDTYLLEEPDDSAKILFSFYLDIFFTLCFTLELLVKAISIGFVLEKGSYLRDMWNQLDFVIVIISLLELAFQEMDVIFIKVLRLLRTLRPLRFITHNSSMKMMVNALIDSFCSILNVIVVLAIVWLMFAILGVSLFAGKFYTCENPELLNEKECDSYGFDWVNADSNFDNVLEATLTLFIISTFEGWPEIMFRGTDARDEGLAPEKDYNPLAAYYFIIFIFIGAFFFANLFIGVVFMQFNKARLSSGSAYSIVLDRVEMKWIELQKLIVNAKPLKVTAIRRRNKIRKKILQFTKDKKFDIFVVFCIFAYLILAAMMSDDASSHYLRAMSIANGTLTIVLMIEATLKMYGAGLRNYFHRNWNKFDFLVVFSSILELVFSSFAGLNWAVLRVIPMVMKFLKIFRYIKMFEALKPLQNIVIMIESSLGAVLNIFYLLTLMFFIYSILGSFIFYDVENGFDQYTNFNNFGMAMLILLRICTGDHWNSIMFDVSKDKGLLVSACYFCSFISIAAFIMLNLFIMVIVQAYEDYKKHPESPLQIFKSDLKKIKKEWIYFSEERKGTRIDYKDMADLLIEIGKVDRSMGAPNFRAAIMKISVLDLNIGKDGFVYYNDFLFAILKMKHYGKHNREKNGLQAKIIRKEEAGTSKILYKIREKVRGGVMRQEKLLLNFSLFSVRGLFVAWKQVIIDKKRNNLTID